MVFVRQRKAFSTTQRDENLKSSVARKITQHACVVGIIFDDQQNCIVWLQIIAVIGDFLHRMLRNPRGRQLYWRYRSWRPSLWHRRTGRSHVGLRQVEGKRAASIWSAA